MTSRRRKFLLIALLMLAAGIVAFFWPRTSKSPVIRALDDALKHTADNQSSLAASPAPLTKSEVNQMRLMAENQRKLDFCGRLIDQYGAPVPDATITVHIMENVNASQTDNIQHTAKSDANGNFTLKGYHGADLGIMPNKPGYQYQNWKKAWTKDYVPDPANPKELVMWKLVGPEPLIGDLGHGYIFEPDGRQYSIDLAKTVLRDDPTVGQLQIQLKRSWLRDSKGRFDWTFVLAASGGGFIAAPERAYSNEAPISGYKNEFVIAMTASDPDWKQGETKRLFFRKDGPQFGILEIRVNARLGSDKRASVHLEYYLNPSGSRNLEVDPKLVTYVQ